MRINIIIVTGKFLEDMKISEISISTNMKITILISDSITKKKTVNI